MTDPTKKGGRESLRIHKRSRAFFLQFKTQVVLAAQDLLKTTRKRTSLVIAHRLSTSLTADLIVAQAEGRWTKANAQHFRNASKFTAPFTKCSSAKASVLRK